jgi:hypothetical protein
LVLESTLALFSLFFSVATIAKSSSPSSTAFFPPLELSIGFFGEGSGDFETSRAGFALFSFYFYSLAFFANEFGGGASAFFSSSTTFFFGSGAFGAGTSPSFYG